MRRRLLTAAALAATILATVGLGSCRATYTNRVPLGEALPEVEAKSLDDVPGVLPEAVSGAPAVLLLGYAQDAQFDADRWLLGLLQAELPARILEVPAARGFVPGLIRGTIDSGMRSGIPSEDWGVVWTVYGAGADALQRFTGNERARNVRVLLLDGGGRVRWFHDRGYSAGKLVEMKAVLMSLDAATPGSDAGARSE